jgi:hypothetical protein
LNEQEQIEYAKSLLSSQGITVIFQALDAQYTNAWKGSSFTDSATRDEAYHMMRALSALKAHLQSIATSEKINNFNLRLANTNKMR